MDRHIPFALLVALALAGCMGDGSTASHPATSAPPVIASTTAAEPVATDETGSIGVLALSDELGPVVGVQVVVLGLDLVAFTDDAGRATFNGVAPGEYTVVASKPAHTTTQEKGVIARVVANEVTSVTFQVNPARVLSAETSYYRVTPIKGFIACYVYIAPVGPIDQCGSGVFVNGQTYAADPNQNRTHTYNVENPDVQQIHVEMTWTPSNTALASQMRVWNYASRLPCAGQASTGYCHHGTMGGATGSSPVRFQVREGGDGNISAAVAAEAEALGKTTPFPRTFGFFVEPVATRPAGVNVGYSVTYQQGYDALVSVFYGQEGPDGYSALPS